MQASGIASFPNDMPLPPYDEPVVVVPRGSAIGGEASSGSASGSARIGSARTSAAAAATAAMAAAGADATQEMRFSDFPELFQPTRLESVQVTDPQIQFQAGVLLAELLSALAKTYLTSRQLADIVRLIPLSLPGLRVELAVSLFPKVVDLPSFDRVMFALSAPERKRVLHRLGWLNLWSPAQPDGDYILDLRVWEERVMATMLAQLAIAEPGENMRGLGGRGDADFNRIAGWKLPTSWLDKTPTMGILRIHYTSTDVGCNVSWAMRRKLCRHVLAFC